MKIFEFVGIWPNMVETPSRKIGKKIFVTISYSFFVILFASNCFICEDLNDQVYFVQSVILTFIALIKCIHLVLKQQDYLAFLFDPIISHRTDDRSEYDMCNLKVNLFMKFAHTYTWVILISVAINIICTVFLTTEKMLPLMIDLCWQDFGFVYWIALAFDLWGIIYSISISLFHVLLWYIMLNYSIAYQTLGNRLKKLGWKGKTLEKDSKQLRKGLKKLTQQQDSKKLSKNSYTKELVDIVKDHRNLIEYDCFDFDKNYFNFVFHEQIDRPIQIMFLHNIFRSDYNQWIDHLHFDL